jgi:hypothetical protein
MRIPEKYYIAHRILMHENRDAARDAALTWCQVYDAREHDAMQAILEVLLLFVQLHNVEHSLSSCWHWRHCFLAAARGYTALLNYEDPDKL